MTTGTTKPTNQDDKILDWDSPIENDGWSRKPSKTEQQKDAEQEKAKQAVNAHKQKTAGSGNQNQNVLIPITINDCMNYPSKSFILDGMIEVGDVVLFSGAEKIGKTHCLMNLALCMSAGLPWLDDIKTMKDVQGSVLWLDFDMKEEAVKRRINMAFHGLKGMNPDNLTPDVFKNFYCLNSKAFRSAGLDTLDLFNPGNSANELQNFIKTNNVKMCFLDNLVKVEGDADENSAPDMNLVFSNLAQIRDDTGCTFIVIHHTGKNGDRGRGSSAIFGCTDLNLQLDQDANDKFKLKLSVDGARDNYFPALIMRKNFPVRKDVELDENGEIVSIGDILDGNGNLIHDFYLTRDADAEFTPAKNTKKTKSQKDEDAIRKIVRLFELNGNTGLTKNGILNACDKNNQANEQFRECAFSMNRSDGLKVINEAEKRGLIEKDDNGYYHSTGSGSGSGTTGTSSGS